MTKPQLRVRPEPADDQDGDYRWRTADQATATKMTWLLPNRLSCGSLAILEGETSVGKSTFLAHLAASITNGTKFLGRPKSPPSDVLWLAGEEDFGTFVRPRLIAAGADLPRVHDPEPDDTGIVKPLRFPGDEEVLRAAIRRFGLSLIIIEPLVSFKRPEVVLTQEAPARTVVDPLNRLAWETGCCIIVTRGLRKNRLGPRLSHGNGHPTIGDTARSILLIEQPDPESERRILRSLKATGAPQHAPALQYRIDRADGPRMVDITTVEGDAEDVAGAALEPAERDGRQRAREMLRAVLATDFVPAKEIRAISDDCGICWRTVQAVKSELKVRHRQNRGTGRFFHEWGPPAEGWTTPAAPVRSTPVRSTPARKSRKKTNKNTK